MLRREGEAHVYLAGHGGRKPPLGHSTLKETRGARRYYTGTALVTGTTRCTFRASTMIHVSHSCTSNICICMSMFNTPPECDTGGHTNVSNRDITLPPSTRHAARLHGGITSDIHDDIAQLKKPFGLESFSEEVGHVVDRVDIIDYDLTVLHELTNIEMAAIDMFCAVVMLRVIG